MSAATTTRLTAAVLLLAGRLLFAAPDTAPEEVLKSVVVLNFLRYSTWPESGGPIQIGVLGRSSVLATFRQQLEGKSVNGRAVRVSEISDAADARCCQVIYVATDNVTRIRQALAGTRTDHVLTVGEADRFLENGGAVNLLLVDGRISFEVNLAALERSGVQISSRLLRLGQIRGKVAE